MTISWGMLGIEWGKPVFITVIREGRFTRELLEQNGEFTVNIPLDDSQKKFLAFAVQNPDVTWTRSKSLD